jgi:hypothetical protein
VVGKGILHFYWIQIKYSLHRLILIIECIMEFYFNNRMHYGILPDPLFCRIDSIFLRIIKDTSIKSIEGDCIDCEEIAIKAIVKNDTFRINQKGHIHKEILPLIELIQVFLEKGKHRSIDRWPPYLETNRLIVPIRPTIRFK